METVDKSVREVSMTLVELGAAIIKTNPDFVGFTPVHMAIEGNTILLVTFEKAGVSKPIEL